MSVVLSMVRRCDVGGLGPFQLIAAIRTLIFFVTVGDGEVPGKEPQIVGSAQEDRPS